MTKLNINPELDLYFERIVDVPPALVGRLGQCLSTCCHGSARHHGKLWNVRLICARAESFTP